MDIKEELQGVIEAAREKAVAEGALPEGAYSAVSRLEVPPKKEFGDFSSNAAMQWARVAHMPPRKIAEILISHISSPLISKIEIAGAGFLNFYLTNDTVYAELTKILEAGAAYGDLPKRPEDTVLVE